jgi:hypothetical protein
MVLLIDLILGLLGTLWISMMLLKDHPSARTWLPFAAILGILLGPVTLGAAVIYSVITLLFRSKAS